MPTKVLLVDDDEKLVSILERSLAWEGFDVVTSTDGSGAVATARATQPNIALVDIGMPTVDGFETCRRLRLELELPVIMLTGRDEVPDKVRAFELGADDYVTKPFALEELIVRMKAVLRRSGAASEPLRYDDLTVDLDTRRVVREQTLIELTPTEFDLLSLFIRHPRQVLSRSQLMDQVWGHDEPPCMNAVEAHIARLRRKLEVGGRSRLIETIRGVGYVLRSSGSPA